MEGVIQSSRGWVDPERAFGRSGPKPTNQQTSDTGGEGKQDGGGGGDGTDEGRMLRLCFHSWTELLSFCQFSVIVKCFLSSISTTF